MQSQDFGPAKWSIAQRLDDTTDAEITRAVDDGAILRTHVLRPTWHFVARDDLRWLMALSGPRVQKATEARYGRLGLDPKTRSRAERLIAKELAGNNHLSRKELGAVLRKSRIDTEGQRLPHLVSHCELESVVCSGPVRGKEQTYALFDERVPTGGSDRDRDGSIAELVRRYLTSHGPSTLKDMSWWSGLTAADLKKGLEATGAHDETIDGLTLWAVDRPPPGGARKDRALLLQAYDEFIVGFTESRYLGDPHRARARAALPDQSVPNGLVLVGTHIAGHWRRSLKDKRVEAEVLLYEKPSERTASEIRRAADVLGRFLGKEASLEMGRMP
jgi:hypothetical protein